MSNKQKKNEPQASESGRFKAWVYQALVRFCQNLGWRPQNTSGRPQNTWSQILGPKYLVPNTWSQILGPKYLVPNTWYQVFGTKYLVPNTPIGPKVLVPIGPKAQGPGPNRAHRAQGPGPNRAHRAQGTHEAHFTEIIFVTK